MSRQVTIGGLRIGGGAPVVVQSMAKTPTHEVEATVDQIHQLEAEGCELVRVAVPNRRAARALGRIRPRVRIPLVADVHFNAELALLALDQGADALRVNPGNTPPERLRWLARQLARRGTVVRIGVNAGSLPPQVLRAHGGPTAEALVETALQAVRLFEAEGAGALKVSLKSSDVATTVRAYRLMARASDHPLHLGVTEAGPLMQGCIRSALAMGALLAEGIGDTIRVSLTAHPVWEVRAGYEILRSLGLRQRGVQLISCPTCGRCRVDLEGVVAEAEGRLRAVERPLKVAIMGCEVNGPGEAREADLGVAFAGRHAYLFRGGQVVRRVEADRALDALLEEIARCEP